MYPYRPLYPTNNAYLPPPQPPLAFVLTHHFGPYGTGPVSPAGMRFLNAVAPGLTSNPRPAIMPPPPRPLAYHPQDHDYQQDARRWEYPHKCNCSCHYRLDYYHPHYGYSYNYGPRPRPPQVVRY
ncbi:hypothetical protein F5Y06DRAFT_105232 [Hypoxylon sp. FL0890]|nr:hypothetical protein F5Y06DRAFT_105232 [Hypoxylon sp. FL0890]